MLLETDLPVTVNVAVDALAATVTVEGTVAALVLLLLRETTTPPVGAVPVSVTVPVEVVEAEPPTTNVGFRLSELTWSGMTVSVFETVFP